jgi:hypothetical protein
MARLTAKPTACRSVSVVLIATLVLALLVLALLVLIEAVATSMCLPPCFTHDNNSASTVELPSPLLLVVVGAALLPLPLSL